MTNTVQEVTTEVVETEVTTPNVEQETKIPSFLDNVDEALVEEYKAMTPEQIIKRMDENQKRLEQSLVEREQAYQELHEQMERTQFITSLAEKGLSEFAELFTIKDVNEQVAFIENAVNQILVRHSYQPKDVAQQEQYTQAINEGNVEKALGFKLSKFFGK